MLVTVFISNPTHYTIYNIPKLLVSLTPSSQHSHITHLPRRAGVIPTMSFLYIFFLFPTKVIILYNIIGGDLIDLPLSGSQAQQLVSLWTCTSPGWQKHFSVSFTVLMTPKVQACLTHLSSSSYQLPSGASCL